MDAFFLNATGPVALRQLGRGDPQPITPFGRGRAAGLKPNQGEAAKTELK